MKALKIILGFVLTIVVLMAGTTVALNYFLDFNKHIPKAEKLLEDKTGLDWTIEGPVKLSLFPSVNVSVQNIAAKDAGNAVIEQLKGQAFSFESAGAKVSWFPHALSKSLIVKDVSLKNLNYQKAAPNGGSMEAIIDKLSVQDIFVAAPKEKGGAPEIRPNSGAGVGLALDLQMKQMDKAGKLQNHTTVNFDALLDMAANSQSKSVDILNLKDATIKINVKMPVLKPAGLDALIKSDVVLDTKNKHLKLPSISIKTADQALNGDVDIKMAGQVPSIHFNFAGKNIQGDALLDLLAEKDKAESATSDKKDTKTAKPKKQPKPLPVLNVNGKVVLEQVSAKGFVLDKVDATIKGQGGVYKLSPLNVDLYSGAAVVNAYVNGQNVPAQCSVNINADKINLGGLLLAAAQQDVFDGLLKSDGQIRTPCLAGPVDLSKANGSIKTTISDGVIQKWQVSKALNQALSVAKAIDEGQLKDIASLKNAMNVKQGDDRFEFTQMVANVDLKDGLANNTVFDMQAPFSQIAGNGVVNLVKKNIDYNLKLNLSKSKDNNKYFIPVKISGPLTKPSYKIDTQSLLKSQAKSKIKEKIQDEIGDKIGDKIGKDLLKALPF